MPILADAHISSLGYQCGHKKKRACEKEKRVSPSGTLVLSFPHYSKHLLRRLLRCSLVHF